jgi:hypothetical protein
MSDCLRYNRLLRAAFTYGATGNLDARLTYGYLWNLRGTDLQIGPGIGGKWRFAGDGRRSPSLSFSFLYASNSRPGGRSKEHDLGTLLIVQYPVRPVTLLANLGRVWVSEDAPDLRYIALAVAAPISRRALAAVEYIDIDPLGDGPPGRSHGQAVLALVYNSSVGISYSLQIGRSTRAITPHWNTTLGVGWKF